MTPYNLFFFRAFFVALFITVSASQMQAQNFVFHAEFVNAWAGPGYNFANDINGYPSVTVQATSTDDEFIIEADNYYNKWDNYGTCDVNVVTPFVFYGNTPSFDPGNSFLTDSTLVGKYYTARIKNVAYTSTSAIIMETDNAPVIFGSITPVTQLPLANAVPANTPVDVTITIDQARSIQEKVYIRYTNDNWATSQAVAVTFANQGDIVGHAFIPSQTGGTTVKYYAFTTTVDVAGGVGDYDLITLKQETNAGANYEYTVMMPAVGTAEITFQVNMSTQTVGSGVYLAGSFNGFSGTANPMTLIGNGIYAATISVDTTLTVQYKFVNGTTYETGNANCGIDDNFGGYNRNFVIPQDDFTLDPVCFNECVNCVAPTFADVTFRVNMTNQTVSPQGVFLAGSFNGFSSTADSMILVGSNIYEKTLSLDTTLSIQYKFVNGGMYETGNSACGQDDGLGGYNRFFDVSGTATVLPVVCFNECTNCYIAVFSDVTFRVNMTNQSISPQGVFLAGSFNGFSSTADSMLLVATNIYEITLSLDTSLSIQYKFVNGGTYETGNSACGQDDGLGGYNRVFDVSGTATVLPLVCFNECVNCYIPVLADVTFRVNMSNQTVSPQGVFLAGSFNGFSSTADSMVLVGNGVYELTLSLDTNLSVQYKFVNGTVYEGGNAACGVDDGLGGYNRVLDVAGTSAVLPIVCFNECADCLPVALKTTQENALTFYPVPAQNYLFVNTDFNGTQVKYEIINQNGALMLEGSINSKNEKIDMAGFATGLYFIRIMSDDTVVVKHFIKA